MILYVHGFSSSGNAMKAKLLREYYGKNEIIISPDLPVEPEKAFELLENILNSSGDDKNIVIGSSLGGFYTLALHRKYNVPVVIINPALYPWIQLKIYLGENENQSTGKKFLWKKEYLKQLKKIEDNPVRNSDLKNVFLLVATDDELIDYNETISILGNTGSLIIWDNCGHEFRRFSEALELIDEFYHKVF